MSLIKCSECGRKVSTDAASCPGCGTQKFAVKKSFSKKHPFLVFLLLACFVFPLAMMVIGGIASIFEKSPEVSAKNVNDPTPVKKVSPEQKLEEDAPQIIAESKVKLKEISTRLNKYYATKDDMSSITDLLPKMIRIAGLDGKYSNEAKKEISNIEALRRKAFASNMEEVGMSNGVNMNWKVQGKENKILRIEYALMSQAMVYNLRNKQKIDNVAKDFGFSKIIYSDRFDSSWTIDLE